MQKYTERSVKTMQILNTIEHTLRVDVNPTVQEAHELIIKDINEIKEVL